MSITTTETLLGQIVDVIVREADPERIYLFGSRARGEARDDSDIDLLVVEQESFGPRRSRFHEINRLHKSLASFLIPKDILLYSVEEFEKWRRSANHLVGRCLKEGRLLYAIDRNE